MKLQHRYSLNSYIKIPLGILTTLLFAFSLPEDSSAHTFLYEEKPGDSYTIHTGTPITESSQYKLNEFSPNLTRNNFIETVSSHAQEISKDYGLYASVMIAQAALESNFGKSALAAPPFHNLFGIKGRYNGKSVVSATSEFLDGQWVYPNERFKTYPSYGESFTNNAHLLRNGNTWDPSYYSGAWVENTASYLDTTDWLEERYATDPSYSNKLNRIIDQHDLTRFDSPESNHVSADSVSTSQSTAPIAVNGRYTVRLNDNLYSISKHHNMTVAELQQANNLNSTHIQTEQELKVSETKSPSTHEFNGSYTVRQNDTLYSIANRHNMTVTELQQANSLSSTRIQAGQTLNVNESSVASTNNNATHTVKTNETLYSIANRYDTTVDSLMQINELNTPAIQAEQVLTLRVTTHRVRPGDTLYNIANRYNTTVNSLKEKNHLNSDAIVIGHVLEI